MTGKQADISLSSQAVQHVPRYVVTGREGSVASTSSTMMCGDRHCSASCPQVWGQVEACEDGSGAGVGSVSARRRREVNYSVRAPQRSRSANTPGNP